jgi:hypothetical protein
MIRERYVGEWTERDQHTQTVTETKDDLCTDIEIMKSVAYLVGLQDLIS